jgi:hypothetical protein
MYLEQKNYSKETILEVINEQTKGIFQQDKPAIINGGYPIFNDFDHTTLDMTQIKNGTDNWGQTLSIKLDEERYVTLSVMKLIGEEICIDVKFHGDKEKFKTKAINFINGNSQSIEDLGTLALITQLK